MIIDAIDGDYVPMSMVHLEQLCRAGRAVPQVAVYRIKVRTKADTAPRPAKHEYEYVHINRLALELCKDIGPLTGERANACSVLALFTILTGCDYTQGLPTVGPARVWSHRDIVVPILSLVDGKEESHDQDVAIISLASAVLYAMVYEKRISLRVNQSALSAVADTPDRRREEERIMRSIKECGSMAPGTLAKLPDVNYLRSHSSNALWTLLYWNADSLYPDPYSKTYGYKRIKSGAAGWGVSRPRLAS
ncbi:hypothetical protein GUITHDRAFT_122077 [Guillardia theta CCMP2712]|uniref:Uncharacterized protein n=1 Tax=Guillardia theta (strain CCMP2712) TaxID=905079 RepID=L1I666_GUITC|nr:hypothetical protein GUITHDRAFT_122077 [Guillardia theta CCMP2712]EKX31736.1 hypothetical protein GUITHDRAFT_122077 [Guillardia theta CCMP2712]|eukprot:XP_005818716.1 hypothetical protein GUITHDRAFT_122077 [Guillardia theta CCMP2712]